MLENSKLLNDSWLRWSAESKEEASICIMGVPFDNTVSLGKGAADKTADAVMALETAEEVRDYLRNAEL